MQNNKTIRQDIRYYTNLTEDDRLLQQVGILSENNNLTDVGRRVLCDLLFEDEDNRNKIVELVKQVKKNKQ